MNRSELFDSDFKTILQDQRDTLSLVLEGDTEKIRRFPKKPLLKKALAEGSLRLYLFDPDAKLVMFIPSMDLEAADSRLMPFEDRFSLSRNETFESMNAYISTRRRELSEAFGQGVVRITDCFSLYMFGGPYLVRSFEMDSTGAVAFALTFGDMNELDFDQYDIDIGLQAAETGQEKTI